MAIDYSKLRSLTVRKLVVALKEDGFVLRRSKGVTRLFCHPDSRRVIIHEHRPGQTLRIGTLKEIIGGILGTYTLFSALCHFEWVTTL